MRMQLFGSVGHPLPNIPIIYLPFHLCIPHERQPSLLKPKPTNYNYKTSLHPKLLRTTTTTISSLASHRNNNNTQQHKPSSLLDTQQQREGILLTNMWWPNLKGALGQRVNMEGIVSSVGMFFQDRHLALPHVIVPDIRYIDWAELHRRGFKGVVFDKDNTLTVPYSLCLWAPLAPAVGLCKSAFSNQVAVFSNSAGLYEYDHDGSKATTLEKAIGIQVIRHRVKKPAGTAEEIEKHFGCKASQLIMVGDRPFTDVYYGNRNGFFTILTMPLSLAEEPFIVRQVRKLEALLTDNWRRSGLKPIDHALLPDATQCIKDPPSL